MKWPAFLSPLAIGPGPADSDLSEHVADTPATPPQAPSPRPRDPWDGAPPVPRGAVEELDRRAARINYLENRLTAAASDAAQWKAHADVAVRAAEQAEGVITSWRDECNRRGRLLDQIHAGLRRHQKMYGRASATIGALRAELALARERARDTARGPAPLVHKPWPYCGGDGDPLCNCGPHPVDAVAAATAEDLAARLSRVREILVQQAHDWDLTAESLGSVADASTDGEARASGAAGSAFSACAARLRGIAANIPGHPTGVVAVDVGRGVALVGVPDGLPSFRDDLADLVDPDGAVEAEVVDVESGSR